MAPRVGMSSFTSPGIEGSRVHLVNALGSQFFSDVRFPEQIGSRTREIGVDAKVSVAKHFENRSRAQMPARPSERGFAVQIPGVDFRTRIEEEFDGFFTSERGRAMERSLSFCPAISHEAPGLNIFPGRAIRIRPLRTLLPCLLHWPATTLKLIDCHDLSNAPVIRFSSGS